LTENEGFEVVGYRINREIVKEVIEKASAVRWGTHLIRWRYMNVIHAGVTYHRGSLIPSNLWHLLKRIYVDQDWSIDTTLEIFNQVARSTIQSHDTDIYAFGYYRTDPPRLQWGFLNQHSGVAVVYDMVADLIATVFKPEDGEAFFLGQIDSAKINREEWGL
jgi:hypothetical protein